MADLFDDDELEESFSSDERLPLGISVDGTLDARRRLEKLLEEKRLQAEIDDYGDYFDD